LGIFPIDTVINLKRAERFSGLVLPKAMCGKGISRSKGKSIILFFRGDVREGRENGGGSFVRILFYFFDAAGKADDEGPVQNLPIPHGIFSAKRI